MNAWPLLLAALLAVSATLPLRHVGDVQLPGNATRLDYQSLDPARHLLFIAHLGDGDVVVVDTLRSRVAGVIPGIPDVHGVLAVPQRNRVYASATGTNELVAIDESMLRIVGRAPAGVYPDGIAYDPGTARLFVSDERGNADTVIDAQSFRRTAEIPLDGEVGNTQYDPVSRHIYVNAEGANALVEIDPKTLRIVARTPLPGCDGNHGLLIEQRRFFIACEDNSMLVALERRGMRREGRWSVGEGPDVLALDTRSGVLYVASESGTVSAFRAGNAVEKIADVFFAAHAHTVAADAAAHLLYFPLEDIAGRPVLRVMRTP